MALSTRGLGRPREAVLNRELILQTALRLLDERGERGSGMRDIARELGVRPSALYNHIGGRDELIDGIRELVSDRIDVSGFGTMPWDEAVRHWARSYRIAFAAHPPTIALLAVRPLVPESRTSRMYDAVCGGLAAAGWPIDRVLTVVVALENFILGSALDATARDDMLDPGDDAGVPRFRAAFDARERRLAGAQIVSGEPSDSGALPAGSARPADAAFDLGLEAMIAGLREEYATHAQR